MGRELTFLDLFAGAGGLSEGFIRAGFTPIAHVESDRAACNTLKTRMVYHWLSAENKGTVYSDYLHGHLKRDEYWMQAPSQVTDSVINLEINEDNLNEIFRRIDTTLKGRKLDLIVGGPPCQAYSLVGRARDKRKMVGDKRNYLFKFYALFLQKYKPKYFIFENVTGLLSARDIDGTRYLTNMQNLFEEVGYKTEEQVVDASQHGVPQQRRRVILIGKQGKNTGFYPTLLQRNINITVNDVLRDLPVLDSGAGTPGPTKVRIKPNRFLRDSGIRTNGEPVSQHWARPHNERDLEIYRVAVQLWNAEGRRLNYNDLPERLKTHRNRSAFVDRFKVVAGNLPYAHTVVAHIAKDGHYYIHPDIAQNRSLTPREAARLQTFPDDYVFEGLTNFHERTSAFRQIGNAVPVLLAQRLGFTIHHNYY